ncbi:MAG: hypothetical protein HQL39_20285, partial [Alphaproteobacteria bacterium]|nr:hypothetical protein [Alphaproteobacteria bacterium]
LGITRRGRDGRPLLQVGLAPQSESWQVPADDDVWMGEVSVTRGIALLTVAAPILGRDGTREGTDVLLFDARRLAAVAADSGRLGADGGVLVAAGRRPMLWDGIASSDLAVYVAALDGPPVGTVQPGEGAPHAVAVGRIPSTGWPVLVHTDAKALYGSIERVLLMVGAGVLALLVAGTLGLIAILRPMAGKILVGANVLRHQVEELEQVRADLELKTRKLAESNADLEQFAYVASHDLREPLRTVMSFAQLLRRRYEGRIDAEADEFLGFIVEGAHRMRTRIDDLLAYSRLERAAVEIGPVDLGEAVAGALANLRQTIDESGAVIEAESLPVVQADRRQLVWMFQNLLSNAIKFATPGVPPRIRLWAEKQAGGWRISVADNGIGIPTEGRERLFEIFQRLHASPEIEGNGIGLAMCRRIVERHGGAISADSEPGRGSVFHVLLPQPDEAPAIPEYAADR